MNDRPLASVCVPIFNKKDQLARVLESLLQQTYAPLEIVVSDNGSTDGSDKIAQEFARRDPRVKYYRLESTLNINESWRYCLRLAKGEFIKLHGGDLTTLPGDFLKRMIEPMLLRPEIEFTGCAIRPEVQYTLSGYTTENQAKAWGAVADLCREVLALPSREARARKLLLKASMLNWIGTPYAMVLRRSCLPEKHWSKNRAPFAWPESYADWDLTLRTYLNHRGFFVNDTAVPYCYDADHGFCRAFVDNGYDLVDMVTRTMQPLTVLIDPELAALREQARPEEITAVVQWVQDRFVEMMEMSDEVVAFDHPHFTAMLMPRLYQCVERYRRSPADVNLSRKLRQLRMRLVQHWLSTPAERVRDEYYSDTGRAHGLLMESGLRKAPLDVREQTMLDNSLTALGAGPGSDEACSRWLAVVLLVNLQRRPELKREMVPDWLQHDFAKYAWND